MSIRFGIFQMTQSDPKDLQESVQSRRGIMRPAVALSLILFAAALATGGYRHLEKMTQ